MLAIQVKRLVSWSSYVNSFTKVCLPSYDDLDMKTE